MIRTKIIGTGSYLPEIAVANEAFLHQEFYECDGRRVAKQNQDIIQRFSEITGIKSRRYAKENQLTSDIGAFAARHAIASAGADKESLDYIIVAHNFGDMAAGSNRVSLLPSVASKIKALLEIKNPDCVAYDLPFGCPGWVEGLIHANYFIKSGEVEKCLVIGAETLSRAIDPHDRDSMIFSDGAGAVVVEANRQDDKGMLSHHSQTFAADHAMLLRTGPSNNACHQPKSDIFIKMNGRHVYEFALTYVPLAIKRSLDKANLPITEIKKILIHQANEKMDQAIVDRVFRLCGQACPPEHIMPMTIGWLGNSSVATIPTMIDLILRKDIEGHTINAGDKVVIASVGAGMNINSVVYQF
jgi:3-oxoacyl-[acyl-carrier-protein] synthase III